MSAEIQKFLLRRLVLKPQGEPASALELKLAIRSAFTAIFTEGELDGYLAQLEDSNLVSFAKDEFNQVMVGLTPKGKLAAQRLIKT